MDTDDITLEQQVLGVVIRLDRAAQAHWDQPGPGNMHKAVGLREASNMLRQILQMPQVGDFKPGTPSGK